MLVAVTAILFCFTIRFVSISVHQWELVFKKYERHHQVVTPLRQDPAAPQVKQ